MEQKGDIDQLLIFLEFRSLIAAPNTVPPHLGMKYIKPASRYVLAAQTSASCVTALALATCTVISSTTKHLKTLRDWILKKINISNFYKQIPT